MKKILCVLMSCIVMLGAASAAYATSSDSKTAGSANYTDLKTTNWAYEAVNAMNNKGIVKGYPDGSFKPKGVVTYGEFIKMALIAATGEDVGNAPSVSDSGEKQSWAANYYNEALELKYFGETDIKREQLNHQIPRNDMALILSNILGETKVDNYDELEASLKDMNSTVKNDYDIIKVYAKGLITGYTDGTFKPENTLTRAESATVIYRLTDESKRVLPGEKEEEAVKTNVSELMSNYKEFWIKTPVSKVYDEDIAKVTSYKVITDATPYNMVLTIRFDVTGFECNIRGTGYLIKDGKIVEYVGTGSPCEDKITRGRIYKSDITAADYIAFIPSNTEGMTEVEMTVIVNPFKK